MMVGFKITLRIIIGVLVGTCILLGLFVYLVRQPSAAVKGNGFEGQASPARIKQDLRYMVEDCFPRDAGNPENLLKVAEYVRARFEDAGLDARYQEYEAEGTVFRNVLGVAGPEKAVPLREE